MAAPDEKYIWVVIPAYKLTQGVINLIESIPPIVSKVVVIDDACPDKSGNLI